MPRRKDGTLPWNQLPDSQVSYIPTVKQIKQGCSKIRETWDDSEYLRRSKGYLGPSDYRMKKVEEEPLTIGICSETLYDGDSRYTMEESYDL